MPPRKHPKREKQIINDSITWYLEKKPLYEQLSKKVESIIQEIISDQKIPIHAIFSRAKDVESFSKKIEDPKYTDPSKQVTDLSGIRIITYVESDMVKIAKLLKSYFEIDEKNSVDKSESLGVDRVGYRSMHYIAELPSDRIRLPEYKKFKNLFFEIQIRTILQHAWAEIEHDKDYKFSGELPVNLKRRFKVLAGVLELADREFNQIATEIDQYSISVNSDTKKDKLNISIDSISLKSFINVKFPELVKLGMWDNLVEQKIVDELRLFGITTLEQLDKIIPLDIVKQYQFYQDVAKSSFLGFLRHLMLINDAEKYFTNSWRNSWQSISSDTVKLLEHYNVNFASFGKQYNIFTATSE